jgi:pimeloyl-[acyl-carrier protein] methyl ester esterase
MNLYVETHGSGPDLVLLHGWGLHAGIWGKTMDLLARHCTVHALDLPGHGASHGVPLGVDDDALVPIAACIPPGSTVLGWSMGGMFAQRLALAFPERVHRLILLSTTPRFVRAWDWPHGVAAHALESFAEGLRTDYRKTISQFLALQSLGSTHARTHIHQLRERLFAKPVPSHVDLSSGLTFLQSADLRPMAHRIAQPTLVMAGARDALTPVGASQWLANTLSNVTLDVLDDGAHALFLSHPEHFTDRVTNFCLATV